MTSDTQLDTVSGMNKKPSITPRQSRKKEKPWYQKPEFLEERFKWYQKLEKSGFKDIEYHDYGTGQVLPVMKGFSPMDAVRYYHPDAAEYYRQAEHHILAVKKEYGARDWRTKAWTLHSQGLGTERIAKALNVKQSAVVKLVRIQKADMLLSQQIDDVEAS